MIHFPTYTYRLKSVSSLDKAITLEEKIFSLEGVIDVAVSFEEKKVSIILQDNIKNEEQLIKDLSLLGHKKVESLSASENLFLNNVVASFGYRFGEKGNEAQNIKVDTEGEISQFQENAPGDTYRYQCGSSFMIRHKFTFEPSQVLFSTGVKIEDQAQTFWGRRLQIVCDKCYCCAGFKAVKSLLKLS